MFETKIEFWEIKLKYCSKLYNAYFIYFFMYENIAFQYIFTNVIVRLKFSINRI